MRITDKEKESIVRCVLDSDPNAKIYLFGSRVNDQLKGGDIDLLVISESVGLLEKIQILSLIKQEIGDQKIDLLISTKDNSKTDPFVQSVMGMAVLLG